MKKILFGMMFSSTCFGQVDLTQVYDRIADVQSELARNRDDYTNEDVQVIMDQINAVFRSVRSPSGSGSGSTACYNRARLGGFDQSQAKQLCDGNSRVATADCGVKAFQDGFAIDEAIELCMGKISIVAADCAIEARLNGPFSRSEALTLCMLRPNPETAQCAIRTYGGPFSKDQAFRLCRDGGDLRDARCALHAVQTMTAEDAISFCR